ncbi:hypothetical protein FW774_11495 [Pedobacter sp. BS3]|uniref:hypothetical protein n=1 Tax=Pedobacter sp. BS3 TaxID=2567937 RepID=UPI0011EF9355|nr:hypothetical protein [Pedobacter sp. BS3]TZF84060.1 hypothetical protein FW774_11495 [Pedobacter sp. BS3]
MPKITYEVDKEIAARLKYFRKTYCGTLEEVSAKTDITVKVLNYSERGLREIPLRLVAGYAVHYNLNVY